MPQNARPLCGGTATQGPEARSLQGVLTSRTTEAPLFPIAFYKGPYRIGIIHLDIRVCPESKMQLAAASAVIAAVVFLGTAPVEAVDNRLLYTIPKKDIMDVFRNLFEQTCTNGTWKPPPPKGLSFEGFIFQPGDYSGKNAATECRIVCSWHNASAPNPLQAITFTTQVAEYLGATKTSD
ncbi:hypothetical protein FB451DRAFT_1232529 [Mycena latifolia]|nr:hypothetical protein FB451DRAFT_1232529 [Mycena latifolia]